jgi:hypothetical protein
MRWVLRNLVRYPMRVVFPFGIWCLGFGIFQPLLHVKSRVKCYVKTHVKKDVKSSGPEILGHPLSRDV